MNQRGGQDPCQEARYANDFRAGYNRDEFVLDFGQSFTDAGSSFFWRIVTSPACAREVWRTLGQSLSGYVDENGPIGEEDAHR